MQLFVREKPEEGVLSLVNNFSIIPSDLIGLKQNSPIVSSKRKKRDFLFLL